MMTTLCSCCAKDITNAWQHRFPRAEPGVVKCSPCAGYESGDRCLYWNPSAGVYGGVISVWALGFPVPPR